MDASGDELSQFVAMTCQKTKDDRTKEPTTRLRGDGHHPAEHHLSQLPSGRRVLAPVRVRVLHVFELHGPQVVHRLDVILGALDDFPILISHAVDLLAAELQDDHRRVVQRPHLHELHLGQVQYPRIHELALVLPKLHLTSHPLQHLLAHGAPLERLHVALQVRAEHLRHVPSNLRDEAVHVKVRHALLDRPVRLRLLRLGEERALGDVLDPVHHRVVARLPSLARVLQHLFALFVRRGLLQTLQLAEHGRDVRAQAGLFAHRLPRGLEPRLRLFGDCHRRGPLVRVYGSWRHVPGP
mmetsp:Transcript_801/g.3096  ORF Transcript_801/g.3096 Transcript_801/m.3096 type:complete len:297 (-) Transcript_801:466-1356(-)